VHFDLDPSFPRLARPPIPIAAPSASNRATFPFTQL
jgi:hypothetical protein